jgi:hypothetical protein
MFRRIFANKYTIILIGLGGIAALIVLASGLQSLEFQPARLAARRASEEMNVPAIIHQAEQAPLIDKIIFAALVVLLLALSISLLDKQIRAWLLRVIPRAIIIAWAVLMLMSALQPKNQTPMEEPAQPAAESAPAPQLPDIPKFDVNALADSVTYWVSVGVAFGLLIAAWWFWNLRRKQESPLEEIAVAARAALDDLTQGGEVDDAVIRCYVRMSAAVSKGRGLIRQSGMTPGEFAQRMEQNGLPSVDVRQLTRLFEAARYGGKQSTDVETGKAAACLNAIILACEARR